MDLKSSIESLLFISIRPLSVKAIAQLVDGKKEAVEKAVEELIAKYNQPGSGIKVVRQGEEVQMATASENAKAVRDFLKDETTGELTRPQLETLTIIAYRGPVAKTEIEQVRGVNCSLILRNLLIRGLVEAKENKKLGETYYTITFDFMRHLGITDAKELPDYQKLSKHESIEKFLESAPAQ